MIEPHSRLCLTFFTNDHICSAPTGAIFSETTFFTNCQARPIPHTSSYMSGHHLATVRRAGRKRGAIFESSEALQWRTQPWSCMDAAPGCRLHRRSSVNILTAWPYIGHSIVG